LVPYGRNRKKSPAKKANSSKGIKAIKDSETSQSISNSSTTKNEVNNIYVYNFGGNPNQIPDFIKNNPNQNPEALNKFFFANSSIPKQMNNIPQGSGTGNYGVFNPNSTSGAAASSSHSKLALPAYPANNSTIPTNNTSGASLPTRYQIGGARGPAKEEYMSNYRPGLRSNYNDRSGNNSGSTSNNNYSNNSGNNYNSTFPSTASSSAHSRQQNSSTNYSASRSGPTTELYARHVLNDSEKFQISQSVYLALNQPFQTTPMNQHHLLEKNAKLALSNLANSFRSREAFLSSGALRFQAGAFMVLWYAKKGRLRDGTDFQLKCVNFLKDELYAIFSTGNDPVKIAGIVRPSLSQAAKWLIEATYNRDNTSQVSLKEAGFTEFATIASEVKNLIGA